MKVLIVSDTHKSHDNLEQVIEMEKPLDHMIHLGDAEGYEDLIESMAQCPLDIVAGNCDWGSDLPTEKMIELENHVILMTHGHEYYVSTGMETLIDRAVSSGADIVMFGHTHRPFYEETGEVTILNPGSISYPRQEGHVPSYAVMDIQKDGEITIETKYFVQK